MGEAGGAAPASRRLGRTVGTRGACARDSTLWARAGHVEYTSIGGRSAAEPPRKRPHTSSNGDSRWSAHHASSALATRRAEMTSSNEIGGLSLSPAPPPV
eukprot:scaffold19983_cov26-Tisochrysis_lutea.AAC.4